MKHAPSHPTHPRFQAAALFHIVRLICLGCCETKNLFVKGCLFLQRLSIFSTGVFSMTFFVSPGCLFFKDSPSLQQFFFSKAFCFDDLSVFFLKDSPSFQHFFFSKIHCFYCLCVFFSKTHHLFNTSFFQRVSRYNFSFSQRHLSFSQRLTFGPIFFAKISLPSPTPPHLLSGGGEACIHIFQQASQ